jgi:hypothetical protein
MIVLKLMATGGVLSGSTDGRAILVDQTSSGGPAKLIHTGIAATDQVDRVSLWAFNSHTSSVLLTLEWGGTTDPNDIIEITIPNQDGLYALTPAPGLPIRNSLVIRAFAATINVITIHGFVVRATAAEVWG